MYSSLLEWCKFPVLLHKYKETTRSGDAVFDEPVEYMCYPVEMSELIKDKVGNEYLSELRIYLPADIPISVEDMLTYPTDARRREIRKLGGYSDGNTGKRDIWVVYL